MPHASSIWECVACPDEKHLGCALGRTVFRPAIPYSCLGTQHPSAKIHHSVLLATCGTTLMQFRWRQIGTGEGDLAKVFWITEGVLKSEVQHLDSYKVLPWKNNINNSSLKSG